MNQASEPRHAEPERASGPRGLAGSLGLTLLSAVVPGSGLISTRLRPVGAATTLLAVAALAGTAALAVAGRDQLVAVLGHPSRLQLLALGLVVVALVWVALIVTTFVLTRPRGLGWARRLVAALFVAVLCFAVAAPLGVAAEYVRATAAAINKVAKSQKDTKSKTRPTVDTRGNASKVWDQIPRVNVLLVGLDDNSARNFQQKGQVNTDTMMVASMDTKSGNTVITQIPRQTARVPFATTSELGRQLAAAYPQGFYNGDAADEGSMASAIWSTVPADHPELFANTDYPGADALKLGLEGAIGLKIDYFVSIDIDGLEKLIDALGGVTVNVNQRVPIGGKTSENVPPIGWIEPGPNQHLDGYHAMWFARGRFGGDDPQRMARQSCTIKAVLDQANPQTMVTKFEGMLGASSQMLNTDIPREMFPAFVELGLRVKGGKQTRVLFVHDQDGFKSTRPDFELMHRRVADAIAASGGTAATPGAGSSGPAGSATPSSSAPVPSAEPTTTQAPQGSGAPSASSAPAQDLSDACAYHPR